MTRLPSRLQPLWPFVKRLHRLASLVSGVVGRCTGWLYGARALPRRGTESADQTVALEPGAVSLHRLAEGESIRRVVATGTPPEHWVFARKTTFDVAPRFSLEIQRGIVVGDYGANITPGGILDYETSEYFGLSGWKEHPLFLRRRLPPIEDVDGTVVALASRGGSHNYFHFLLDVLPRFGVFEDTMPGRRADALYVPAGTAYQRTFLELAGLDGYRIIPAANDRAVRADHLVVPSLPNRMEVAPTATVTWLRSRLPPKHLDDKPRRIYVTRGDRPNTRRLVREAELLALLEPRGFVSVNPGQLSAQEQIDVFAAAEVVVAPHGAALTNLLFVSPGTRVLELFASNYVNSCFWAITQGIPDVDHRYLMDAGASRHGPGDPMNKIQADIDLDPAAVMEAVDALLDE